MKPALRHILLAGCLVLGLTASAADAAKPDFMAVIGEKFAAWDRDHDGALSVGEIDAAVADPALKGPAAAAAAALKRAARDPKLKLPSLTLPYLRETAAGPAAKDKPDFAKMFAQGRDRLGALTSRELFVGQPRLTTLHQGKLGNCFSLAPLGALLHRDPASAAALIQPEKDGRFRVTFGKASAIVTAPTDAEIALTSSNEDAGVWVNVYEKALGTCLNEAKPAEQRGGSPIDALARGGSAGTMLSYVTGHDIVRIRFAYAKDKNLADPGRAPQTAELRRQMTAAVAEHRLMTCGTIAVTTPGLTPNHAYAVLGYDAKADTVELWNPHGDDFTPKGEAGLKFGYPKKDGVFRMPVADWIAQFSGMAYEVNTVAAPKSAAPAAPAKAGVSAPKVVGDASTPEGARRTYE